MDFFFGNSAEATEKTLPEGNAQTLGLQPRSQLAGVALAKASSTAEAEVLTTGGALLPDSGPLGTAVDIEEPVSDQISLYTVRAGDTLSEIAEMYGVSVNTIAWANDMTIRTPLKEGQTLVILPVSGVRYTVGKGDTLQSIAKKFNGDVDEITRFNDLAAGNQLVAGQIIIIPNGEVAPASSSRSGGSPRFANAPSYAGYYAAPVAHYVKTQGLHGYNAVDLAAALNTPIMAAADGQVIVSKDNDAWNGGYGNYIVIQHPNKTQTLYAHLSKNLVTTGQPVLQGQTIGLMGNTGKVSGPTGVHLHFEVRGAKNPF